jgi:hypothetical protein
VFEFWFVLVAARVHASQPALTSRRAGAWLLGLTALKELQEVVLHWWSCLDQYTFFEFWRLVWRAISPS